MHHPPHLDIDKLITDENDPKFRVLLMLVKSLSDYLAGNTEAVNDMSNKLDAHLSAFEARAARDDELRNQGRGAWRVLAWVLGIVQVIGLGIWVEAKSEIKDIHTALVAAQRTDAGDLPSDRAPMHQELTLTMPALSEAERSQMMQIMRANGIWKPVFISLLPRAGTAIEQDHMIYGKRKNTPMDLPYFATFAHSMEIESW